MTGFLKVIGLLAIVLHCNGLSRRPQSKKYDNRRFALPQDAVIIGAPAYPNHLPEAEAILPGHTLIRPGLGMLKSAVKFPHRELEGGSGVYGNWDNLGIRYDGKNERVLYTGFRRLNSNSNDPIVLILPSESIRYRTETKEDTRNELLSRIIQDMLNDPAKLRNLKSPSANKYYSSEEIRISGQENRKDKYNSFMLQGGLQKNGLNQAIDRILKSFNLKNYAQTKYINSIIDTIKSLRRYKINDNNIKVKQTYNANDKNRLDEKVHHKYDEIKISKGKPAVKDAVIEDSLESDEISNIREFNIAVTTEPKSQMREQRKRELFWQTKDAANHIKINENAPDFDEFLPKTEIKNMEQIQSWWYYNQADYTQLQEKRRHELT